MPVLTSENKRQIKRLLASGRWNNESEIMRAALHLLVKDFESRQRPEIESISAEAMEKILREETADDRAVRKAATKASVRSSQEAIRKMKR